MPDETGRLVACFLEDGTVRMELDIPRDQRARDEIATDLRRIADDISSMNRRPMAPWHRMH